MSDTPGGIDQEIYLAVLIDRARRRPMVMVSAEGGMDIEEVNEHSPEKIFRAYIEPALGVRSYQTTYLASAMDLPRELWRDFHKIVAGLYSCFKANDASLTDSAGDYRQRQVDGPGWQDVHRRQRPLPAAPAGGNA